MSGREDDITTPPLSQDTPPQPWTPPAHFGSEAASRSGVTVDVSPTATSTGSAIPNRQGPPWTNQQRWEGKRQRHGSPVVGPILLIAAGVVFLLNNMGVLPWAVWGQVWRLWPLVLVAIGLDMLLGRRSTLLSFLIVLGVLAGGVGVLYYTGGFDPGTLVRSSLSVPLSTATGADLSVKIGNGDLTLDGKVPGEQLATGTLEYYDKDKAPVQSISSNGGRVAITLEQVDNNPFSWFSFGSRNPRWDLHLSPEKPFSINADSGTGDINLDLSNLKLDGLRLGNGTGDTTVRLPMPSGTLIANLHAGTGDYDITLPTNIEASIKIHTGTGDQNVPSRFQKKGDELYESPGYSQAKDKLDMTIDLGTGDVDIR